MADAGVRAADPSACGRAVCHHLAADRRHRLDSARRAGGCRQFAVVRAPQAFGRQSGGRGEHARNRFLCLGRWAAFGDPHHRGFWRPRSLLAIAAVAILNVATTAALLAERPRAGTNTEEQTKPAETVPDNRPMSRVDVGVIVIAFIALQAANSSAVSIMTLFVTETLGLDVIWAGIALGVAAGVEIPALLVLGRLSYRFSSLALIASGCVVGIAYYTAMVFVSGPVLLIGLQVLDAWFFAVVAGVGLTLFQHMIPRPGLASGLFVNTRRLGAIVSGVIISIASMTPLGYGGIFAACAALTLVALVAIGVAARITTPGRESDGSER